MCTSMQLYPCICCCSRVQHCCVYWNSKSNMTYSSTRCYGAATPIIRGQVLYDVIVGRSKHGQWSIRVLRPSTLVSAVGYSKGRGVLRGDGFICHIYFFGKEVYMSEEIMFGLSTVKTYRDKYPQSTSHIETNISWCTYKSQEGSVLSKERLRRVGPNS